MQKTTFFGQTDIGKLRQKNEDTFIAKRIWGETCILAVVIDGMGGHEGGEVAAKIAKKTIVDYFRRSPKTDILYRLQYAVLKAHEKIKKEQLKDNPELWQMGCVLTACIVDVDDKELYVAHVGDTRLYVLHDNELLKYTDDHSEVGYLEAKGFLTEKDAMNHPNRNIIDRYLGSDDRVDLDYIEILEFEIYPNDTLLLCSDGLTDLMTSYEIYAIISQENVSLETKTQQLIDKANEKGGFDNITVVLIENR
jgi:serine/threonine protein phosphatase PrpC